MRIKVEGDATRERIISILDDLVSRTPDGATISGLNMYFTLRDHRGVLIDFLGHEGEPLDMVTYKEPRRQVPLHSKPKPRKVKKPTLKVVNNTPAPATQSAA
jgi:hypothetical protein